ncbi:UDP-2,3-diacylglucosamine diphosphatase LpxI [Sulfitobacter mediterraneus]|uniref:LpxI family protein n=1 Tax=Sulfitobacter mediterraneus TaxID=83219 RepID=UPI00193A8B61|nr:UDP-2,3-diacylglucosamine diphosphatase LpxI [Sulfitobacter mediterraneus]MBM1556710.1 UDP-2,3-diacylglucosamine diphosphatase LpxI [Sulfitobacter mediterraneus]MBM1568894.1 UDP-2,3-diacylglucosamine diphosphatase LpxI [Sulfitobacter mediterraneus]MBM1572322.1 UDP-2,3-diacylglucosamine diphosphatase LpxI [Sulfitobacter mediterraneus]MBM1576485.1 UDP-2,3-diacylglucosamine diphosphatase LpxI [Sulfitobacter mediterraneus]MBM1579668.1 UDP-2,3-diacylglucosamine diphosphatase LpxI [Sulfitobacter 
MTLALIAGRGDLPAKVAAAQDQPPLICGYDGMLPDLVGVDLTFRLETLGTLLVQLGERGITKVCFCGAIDRPALDPSKLDAETLPLVPLFQKALAAGDNGALQILMQIFEQTGFKVVGADELLPELVAQQGVLSDKWPDAQMRKDAAKGEAVLAGLAALDIGQACVIGREQVLGVETIGGTDHLLSTLPPETKGACAILCKGPKEGQIREIDMPTIGPNTLTAAHAAGLAGVVVDAGDVIILEQDRCAALADELGLVLWVRRGGEG